MRAGRITWKPYPELGAPSPWMEIAASACALLAIAAGSLTHGPMPWWLVRVSTTFAPSDRKIATSRVATSKLNACSWYPDAVEVPEVLHGFWKGPAGTGLAMRAGWEPFSPLWPGSI